MTSSRGRILRLVRLLLRLALGIIFIYAAWVKLFGTQWSWPPQLEPWAMFAKAIFDYGILSLKGSELVARTLPWLELAIGLMLLVGRGLRIASTGTSLLLLVFFTLMVRAFTQGKEISCGCFGPGEIISWWTLLRDGSMLAGALLLTWMAFQRQRQAV